MSPRQMPLSSQSRMLLAGLLIASAAVAGAFWWLCARSDGIPFLSAKPGAQWIVCPRPAEGARQDAFPLGAVFRRSVSLRAAPAKARLVLRSFETTLVAIDDRPVPLAPSEIAGWKSGLTVDVTGLFHAGTNVLSAWVTNMAGPPALWLQLETEQGTIPTDERWEASLAGAAWQHARLATCPPPIGPDNPLDAGERTLDSVKRAWPLLAAFAAASLILLRFIEGRSRRPDQPHMVRRTLTPGQWTSVLLAVVIVARAALFVHNVLLLPPNMGFDAPAHEDYIQFIQQNHALPLPADGWEMYQPPLYYAAGAVLLTATGHPVGDDTATTILRAVNGVAGLVHCWLVLLCLRLLFPNHFQAQAAGLVVAAFLPPHVYLSQYVTNEPLTGLLVTAAFYFCLRALRDDSLLLYLGIGIALGAAMLSKFSALLVIPFFAVALAARQSRSAAVPAAAGADPNSGRIDPTPSRMVVAAAAGDSRAPKQIRASLPRLLRGTARWPARAALALLSFLAVCGWHYGRIWLRCGRPLVGNWETASSHPWWQDPGFHTSTFYFGFGSALTRPLFSSLFSFADGLYSTLWGDGLASGAARLASRPPWNYDLMNAGYLLAVALSLLFVLGFIVALFWLIRRPTAEWFAVLGVVSAFGLALVYMSLKVPSYAQTKAFYAFPALLPFCAVIVVGWNWLGDMHRFLRRFLWFVLVVWAITAYAAFWIRAGNPQTPLVRGLYLAEHQRDAGARESLSLALQMDSAAHRSGKPGLLEPSRAEAHFNLGAVLDRQGMATEAIAQYRQALRVRNDFAGALNNLAWLLATASSNELRNGSEAIRLAERACYLTHDQTTAYVGTLAAAYAEAGRFPDAVATAQKARNYALLRSEKELATKNEQLLELYRAGKPYRE